MEVLTAQQLHGEIRMVGGIQSNFVDRDDVGVLQGGGNARFPQKPEFMAGAGGVFAQASQRHIAVGVLIVGAVNGLHSAHTNLAGDGVFLTRCGGQEFGGCRAVIRRRGHRSFFGLAVRIIL